MFKQITIYLRGELESLRRAMPKAATTPWCELFRAWNRKHRGDWPALKRGSLRPHFRNPRRHSTRFEQRLQQTKHELNSQATGPADLLLFYVGFILYYLFLRS